MASTKRYPSPAQARRVNVVDISRELGWPIPFTRDWLKRNRQLLGPRPTKHGNQLTYDASVIDVINTLLERPARALEPGTDWLSEHLGGNTHG